MIMRVEILNKATEIALFAVPDARTKLTNQPPGWAGVLGMCNLSSDRFWRYPTGLSE